MGEGPTEQLEIRFSSYVGASPSDMSVSQIKQAVGDLLDRRKVEPWDEVRRQLNQKLTGWRNYFCQGATSLAYHNVDVIE